MYICNCGSTPTDEQEQEQQIYTVTTRIIRTKRLNNLCRFIFLLILLLLLLLLCNFLLFICKCWSTITDENNNKITQEKQEQLEQKDWAINVDWSLCSSYFCYCVMLLFLICNCGSTTTDEQEKQQHKNYTVTTRIIRTKRLNNLCRLVCAVVAGIVSICCWSASVNMDPQLQMNKNKNNKITQKQQLSSEQKDWTL